jgi:hypothetical protein
MVIIYPLKEYEQTEKLERMFDFLNTLNKEIEMSKEDLNFNEFKEIVHVDLFQTLEKYILLKFKENGNTTRILKVVHQNIIKRVLFGLLEKLEKEENLKGVRYFF